MVEVKRETFSVTTIGVGQPDYAQPVAEPVERALVVKFPESEVAGKRYDDFTKINFISTPTEYIVGTNANVAKAGSWPTDTIAKEIAFYATEPCYIRFNDPSAVEHEMPIGFIVRFYKRVERFYVRQVASAGTLYAWIEG